MNNSDQPIQIIAGPCSIDEYNLREVYDIASKQLAQKVRIVGVKSRTSYSVTGMGIDAETLERNMQIIAQGGTIEELEIPPSIKIAAELLESTGVGVATEIMVPHLQIPLYGKIGISGSKFMPWSPSVEQLGWPIQEAALYANLIGSQIAIKNGKWLGDTSISAADEESLSKKTGMESTWEGLATYAQNVNKRPPVLIHRGFDVQGKGDHRNIPIHNLAARVAARTNLPIYFDPSHSFGPKMKDKIVDETVRAMQMRNPFCPDKFLYSGILIEVGTSKTDTEQHITINELEELNNRLMRIRTVSEA